MSVFVLIAGANNGGWYLRAVGSILQDAGHEVYRTTLTGLGERSHLASPSVGLDTHIQDIVNVITYEDLHEVMLMGHSYAGMVITGVAERIPERLAQLVYLDAIVPRDGEALIDVGGPESRSRFEEAARSRGDGWLIPPDLTGNPDPRRSPHPYRCMTQPLVIGNPLAAGIPRTYIYCTADKRPENPANALTRSAARAREAGWRYRELDATHSALRTHPREVAKLLLELV